MTYIPIYKRDEIHEFTCDIWPIRLLTRHRYKRLHDILYMTKYVDESHIYDAFKRAGIDCTDLIIYGAPSNSNRKIILQYFGSSRYSIYVNKDGYIYDIVRG